MPKEVERPRELVAGVRAEVTADEVAAFFNRAVAETMAHVPRDAVAGPVVAVYHRDEGDRFDVTIGMAVSRELPDTGLDVVELPAGPALVATHRSDYRGLHAAYRELDAALAARGLTRTMAIERYVAGPADDPDPATWVTEVIVPLPSA